MFHFGRIIVNISFWGDPIDRAIFWNFSGELQATISPMRILVNISFCGIFSDKLLVNISPMRILVNISFLGNTSHGV